MAKQWRVPPKYENRARKNANKQADALRAQADHTEKTPITSQVRADLGKGLVAYKVGKFVHGRAQQAGMIGMKSKTKSVKWSTVDSSAKRAKKARGTKRDMRKVLKTMGPKAVKGPSKVGAASKAIRSKGRKAKVAAKVAVGPASSNMKVRKSYAAGKAWKSTAKTGAKYAGSRAGATKAGGAAKAWGSTAKSAGRLGKSYAGTKKGKVGIGVAAGAVAAGGAGYAYKRRKAKKAATMSASPKRGRRR